MLCANTTLQFKKNKMVKFSCVIITFNEERHLEKCLKSLVGIVDEIVVVDSLSTDNTKAICQKYNVVFIEQAFLGYLEQKNFACSKATGDYIVSLDGDEALSKKLQEEILNLKNSVNSLEDGYVVSRLNNYCGQWIKYSNWYPDKRLRIFKSGSGQWKGGNPHDYFELYSGKTSKFINADILHWAYDTNTEHYLKVDNFTTIAANSYVRNSKKKIGILTIILNPIWKFIKNYFIKKGVLDGLNGLIICAFASFGTFLKYIKIRELQQNKKNENRI
jgi:glycosyltransferase involved in cell wall biosynthesis